MQARGPHRDGEDTSVDTSARSAEEILAEVARAKNGGASLTFTRRNAVETTVFQWSLVVLGAVLGGLWLSVNDEPVTASLLGISVVQALVAATATVLGWQAYRFGAVYETTDRWDGTCGVLQMVALIAATLFTGGTQSPLWIVVLLAAA